ncbi:MAG: hypothetical protein HFF60_08960 [Oscillospiraceae bacterium]|jgi:hypothetical protein|nr:hypothetical protein [Oscillospiraceae bacterium]
MDFMSIFDILIGFYGLKFLLQWYQSKFQGKPLDPQCLLTTDLTAATCTDLEGLTAFLLPRLLCFGLGLVLYAAISFLGLLAPLGLLLYVLFFGGFVALFLLTNKQAKRRFWP